MEIDTPLLKKVKLEFSRGGISGVVNKVRIKLTQFLFHSNCSVWYERRLNEPISHFSPEIDLQVEFLVSHKKKIVDWLIERKNEFSWIYFEKEIESALQNNHVYLTIAYKGDIIGYVKVGVGPTYIHDFDKVIIFPERAAFIYDTFVLPEYRGKRLALFILNQAAQYSAERGFEKIFCHIESWNVPSVKTFKNAGFRTLDSIRFVRISCFPFFLKNGSIPFLDLEKYLLRQLNNR